MAENTLSLQNNPGEPGDYFARSNRLRADINAILLTVPTISNGSGAPSTVPFKVGDTYIDTQNAKVYIASGFTSSSDWTVLN